MEVSIIRENSLIKNYDFSITNNKKIYSLCVMQLALLDLKALKVGMVKLAENFHEIFGSNLLGFNVTGLQVIVGSIILVYLFNIDTIKKGNWKDLILSLIITIALILIIIL